MSSSQGGWDIGGYAPVGYRVTPWTHLFPALGSFPKAKTLSTIYIAKLYTYYLTRLQFGQYLAFLGDVGPTNCQNDAIATDNAFYTAHCRRLRQAIADASAGTPNSDTYQKVVTDFEATLSTSPTFNSHTVYTRFFAHYSFVVQCAYGGIWREQSPSDGVDRYFVGGAPPGGWKPTPAKPFSVFAMLADAARFYPVITSAEEDEGIGWLDTGWYSDEAGRWDLDHAVLSGNVTAPVLLDSGFRYIQLQLIGDYSSRLYMIGLDTVPEDYLGKIRGLPMLYKMPFDFLASYADPGKT
jgi:hypothetical protein